MKKLIIQIPCYNEDESLPIALNALPRRLDGVEQVEWLIIDDGSTDQTVNVAKHNGVDHVVSHSKNMGLAKAFMSGINGCIERGADIIVNTDADNQYNADFIQDLIDPILRGEADIVIGQRPVDEIEHFSKFKKILQKFGSWTVGVISKTGIPDAPSGFRAISRDAAMRLNVFDDYTYTLETIIQTGLQGMAIISVPIKTNDDLRDSRLVKSISSYVRRSALTILRIFVTYRSFHFFAIPGMIVFFAGFIVGLRFLYYYFTGHGAGHVQSTILASLLIGSGIILIVIGLLADLVSVNRKMLEDIKWRIQKIEKNIDQNE